MKTDVLKSISESDDINSAESTTIKNYEKNNSKIIALSRILSVICLSVFLIIAIALYINFNVSKQIYGKRHYGNRILSLKLGVAQQDNVPDENSNTDLKTICLIEDNNNVLKLSFSKNNMTLKYKGINLNYNNLEDISKLFYLNENLFEMQLMKFLCNSSICYPVHINDYTANARSYIYYDGKLNVYCLTKYENSGDRIKQKSAYYTVNGLINNMSEAEFLNDCITTYSYKDFKMPLSYCIEGIAEKIYNDGKINISFENHNPQIKYEASINEGESWEREFENKISFSNLLSGDYKILIRQENTSDYICSETIHVMPIDEKKANYIPVPPILQLPELPTGCEITSLTMLLNYCGFDADKEVLADQYLPKGKYRASDPNEVFVGDPKSTFAYGCFSNVIAQTAEKYLEENSEPYKFDVKNITGCLPKSVYAALDSGYPVIVWITVDLQEPEKGAVWTVDDSKKEIRWLKGEHCVLLTGYDLSKKIIYANDPLKGITAYDMELFEKRFEQMNRNAVIIMIENDY